MMKDKTNVDFTNKSYTMDGVVLGEIHLGSDTSTVKCTASSSEADHIYADAKEGARLCCWSSCGTRKPSAKGVKLWDYVDIEAEEEDLYRERLLQYNDSSHVLIQEFLTCCQLDCVKRLTVVYGVLRIYHNIHITDDILDDNIFESPLMLSIISESINTALFLIEMGGKELVCKQGQQQLHRGATALHIATLNGRRDLVTKILQVFDCTQEISKYLNICADGQLFQENHLSGLPQILALQCGKLDIYFDFIDNGAEMDAVDPLSGNTVVHTLIEFGRTDADAARTLLERLFNHTTTIKWYCQKLNINPSKFALQNQYEMMTYFLQVENTDGFTSLTYAAKLCVYPVLVYLFDCEGVYKHTQWKLGPVSYVTYDLKEIDPAVANLDHPGKPTVLELLLYGKHHEDDLSILSIQPIKQLMKDKWGCYSIYFILWGLFHCAAMCYENYCLIRVFRYDTNMKTLYEQFYSDRINSTTDVTDISQNAKVQLNAYVKSKADEFIVSLALITTLGCCYFLIQLIDIGLTIKYIVMNRLCSKYTGYYKVPWNVVFRFNEYDICALCFWVCTCLWSLSHWTGAFASSSVATLLLCGSLIFGWLFLLYFTRVCEATSYFTIMVQRILISDVSRFGFVVIILLVGFSSAMQLLYSGSLFPPSTSMATRSQAFYTLFLLLIGVGDVGFLLEAPSSYSEVIYILINLFLIICTILMLNILIAAMSDTYMSLSVNRTYLFLKMRMQAVLNVEHRTLPMLINKLILPKYVKFDHERQKWVLLVKVRNKAKRK